MPRSAVVLAVAVLAVGVGSAAASSPRTITSKDSGKTFVVRRGAKIALRLSGPWVWSEPRTSSASVHLTPIEYYAYPDSRSGRSQRRDAAARRSSPRAVGATRPCAAFASRSSSSADADEARPSGR